MENLRIRLMFEDRNILSKTQRSQGLNQSWLLLKPDQHPKFSDVSAHLLHIFDLHHSCPNGLLLYMDGFVLPPFESTCILKDKDIISVKKKGGRSTNIVKVGDTTEEPEIVEKQPLHTGVLLLANEEFEKEAGGYRSKSEENEEQSEDTVCRPFMESKLQSGITLIVDRYSYSGVAFSSAKGLDIEWCKAPDMDLVIYLDI